MWHAFNYIYIFQNRFKTSLLQPVLVTRAWRHSSLASGSGGVCELAVGETGLGVGFGLPVCLHLRVYVYYCVGEDKRQDKNEDKICSRKALYANEINLTSASVLYFIYHSDPSNAPFSK